MLTLNNLVRAGKKRKRVGRGGSRGATSGRGMGGQKARTGAGTKLKAGFEGGQMPLARRLPKRGFSNARHATEYAIINLSILNSHFEEGATVTYEALREQGIVKGKSCTTVKVLGKGILEKKLIVHAHAFSQSALDAIKKQGGETHLIREM